jgi:uncharacterized protein (TIGR03492 family)
MKILALSNGHGEDAIAVRIIEQLQCHPNVTKLVALPLVGEGNAYRQIDIPILGRVQQMPSGGFVYMDGTQLWGDVRGGLIQLTLEQLQLIKQWGKSGGFILAVGDIVPLLFAWMSGTNYAFVGTAKSEYYLRNEQEWLKQTSWLERQFGSVYLPWERWLMTRPRCQGVFPRDSLTATILQQQGICAYDLGNPMMDIGEEGRREKGVGSGEWGAGSGEQGNREGKRLFMLLLPGSRMPEAGRNWQQILEAVEQVIGILNDYSLVFLAAIASGLNRESFAAEILSQNWNITSADIVEEFIHDSDAIAFTKQNATLILTQNAYQDCLEKAEIAIAMAGTATEQFVGLGKPVITMPGKGPQFTYAFAEAQTRLLGCSVMMVSCPYEVGKTIKSVIDNSQLRQEIAANGKRRMGNSGAAARIAQYLLQNCYL